MRKLRLDVEEIRVESFRTSDAAVWKGTVRGNGELGELAEHGFNEFEIGDDAAAPKTIPPNKSCDTCIVTCETRCTCPTNVGCTTCT